MRTPILFSFLALASASSAFARSTDDGLRFSRLPSCPDKKAQESAAPSVLIGEFRDPVFNTRITISARGIEVVDHDEEKQCKRDARRYIQLVKWLKSRNAGLVEMGGVTFEEGERIVYGHCLERADTSFRQQDASLERTFSDLRACVQTKVASKGRSEVASIVRSADKSTYYAYRVRIQDGKAQYKRERKDLTRVGPVVVGSHGDEDPWMDLDRVK